MTDTEVIAALTHKNLELEKQLAQMESRAEAFREEATYSQSILDEISKLVGFQGHVCNLPGVIRNQI